MAPAWHLYYLSACFSWFSLSGRLRKRLRRTACVTLGWFWTAQRWRWLMWTRRFLLFHHATASETCFWGINRFRMTTGKSVFTDLTQCPMYIKHPWGPCKPRHPQHVCIPKHVIKWISMEIMQQAVTWVHILIHIFPSLQLSESNAGGIRLDVSLPFYEKYFNIFVIFFKSLNYPSNFCHTGFIFLNTVKNPCIKVKTG